MKHSTDRVLTTHSGSMARPPELLKLLADRSEGRPVDMRTFEPMVAQAVADVVRRQVDAGIGIVGDGEQSKVSFASYLKDRLSGFEVTNENRAQGSFQGEASDFPEFYARPTQRENERLRRAARRAVCVGPIEWKDFTEVQRDIDNLRAAVTGMAIDDVFMTAATPSLAAGSQPNRYYASDDDYLIALADVLKREYRAITDAGFVLQVDLPFPAGRSGTTDAATQVAEMRRTVARNLEVLDYALADVPGDQVRLHVCYGSDAGPHHRDPQLKDLIDLLLQAKPAGLTLVGASGRHEFEWKIWRDVKLPEGKVIVAGVIDHTTNMIEHPETVADRIVRYANVLGRENVIAGVDCGFDPSAGIEEYRVDRKIMWAKLRSLSEGAELATRELWGE